MRRFQDSTSGALGLPYFTTNDPEFRAVLEAACTHNALRKFDWNRYDISRGTFARSTVFAGRHGPNDLCKYLLSAEATANAGNASGQLSLFYGQRASTLGWHDSGQSGTCGGFWKVGSTLTQDGRETHIEHCASALLVTIPAPQAAPLIATALGDKGAASTLRALQFEPAWVVLVHANWPALVGLDEIVFPRGDTSYPLARLSRAAPGGAVWQLTAQPVWSALNLECSENEVERTLLGTLSSATGVECSDAKVLTTHRWRYAYGPVQGHAPDFWKQTHEPKLHPTETQEKWISPHTGHPLFLAGDIYAGGDAPSAWHTGRRAAEAIESFLQNGRDRIHFRRS